MIAKQIMSTKVAIICIQQVIVDLKVSNGCSMQSFSLTNIVVATTLVRLNYQEMLLKMFKDGIMSQKVITKVVKSTEYFYQLVEEVDFRYFKVIYAQRSF